MRRRYFTKHLNWAVLSEFERAKMQDFTQSRTISIQQSASRAAEGRGAHDASSPHLVIRRVDTEPQPISSTDFGGIQFRHAAPHGNQALRPGERYDRHDTLHESPIATAVSVYQTQAEQHLHRRS